MDMILLDRFMEKFRLDMLINIDHQYSYNFDKYFITLEMNNK